MGTILMILLAVVVVAFWVASPMLSDPPACRLKPASPAVPAASAKEENKNNNDEKCLGIHDVQPFQYDGFSGVMQQHQVLFPTTHLLAQVE